MISLLLSPVIELLVITMIGVPICLLYSVVVVFHRCHSWVGHGGSLHGTFWYRENEFLRAEAFRLDPAWILWVLGVKCVLSSAIGSITSNLWEAAKGSSNHLLWFESLLDFPDQQLIRGFLMPGIGVFVRKSVACGGSIVAPCGKISFRLCMFIYTHRLRCIICIILGK